MASSERLNSSAIRILPYSNLEKKNCHINHQSEFLDEKNTLFNDEAYYF